MAANKAIIVLKAGHPNPWRGAPPPGAELDTDAELGVSVITVPAEAAQMVRERFAASRWCLAWDESGRSRVSVMGEVADAAALHEAAIEK